MTKFKELRVQHWWNSLESGTTLKTADNCELEIISTGIWNKSAGPDFHHARIKLENQIIDGDIEIHCRASDWFRHNHEPNPAYFNVILHVAEFDDLTTIQREMLPPLLILKADQHPNDAMSQIKPGDCSALFIKKSESQLRHFLEEAGMERFTNKSVKIMRDALADGIEFCTLRAMFDGIGYKNNRSNFVELFNRYHEYPENIRSEHYEAILWGESGLLPDPAVNPPAQPLLDFETSCWDRWWSIRIKSRPQIAWKRSSARPVNSPERRLAAAVQIIKKLGETPLRYFSKMHQSASSYDVFNRQLLEELRLNDLLWNNWTDFYTPLKVPSAVLGQSRANELAVNVVLPALHAYGKLNQEAGLSEFAAKAWRQLPPIQQNIVTRTAAAKWFGEHPHHKLIYANAATSQGAMLLYQKFCENCNSDCAGCRLNDSMY